MWSSLVPQPNGITSGIGGLGMAGAAAVPAAGLAAGGYALQIALVICVFQLAGMLFLAVYSIKAAGTGINAVNSPNSILFRKFDKFAIRF